MNEQQQQAHAAAAVALKLAPGLVGALVALRWVPAGATWADRAGAFVGGCACAFYGSPAIVEWVDIGSPRIEASIAFVTGLLGMVVAAEIVNTVRGLQLAETIRSALSARFGGK